MALMVACGLVIYTWLVSMEALERRILVMRYESDIFRWVGWGSVVDLADLDLCSQSVYNVLMIEEQES